VVQPVDIAVLDYPELAIRTVADFAAAKVVMDVAKGLQFELITQEISNGLLLILYSCGNKRVVHIDRDNCTTVFVFEQVIIWT
jgi:hypothetical protein